MTGYTQFTDKYFLRSKKILQTVGINPIVRYQVFARQKAPIVDLREAIEFIRKHAPDADIKALPIGTNYKPGEAMLVLEGRVQDLIDLETVYLSSISAALSGGRLDEDAFAEMEANAKAIVAAAKNKPVYYFGARHYHWEDDKRIAQLCHDAGFAGTSTDNGAECWDAEGIGTIPHALILTLESFKAEHMLDMVNATALAGHYFDKMMDSKIPRIVLIDTFNSEIQDSIETATLTRLDGVRIDTCGENYAQGITEYGNRLSALGTKDEIGGKGVTVGAVWALRRALDEAKLKNVGIVVSSGFDAAKTARFMQADALYDRKYDKPLFTSIGTGSLYSGAVYATSDICAYYSDIYKDWVPLSKAGRKQLPANKLKEV